MPSLQDWEYKSGHASDCYSRMPTYATSRSTADIRQFLKARNYPHNGPALNFQGLLERVARSLPSYEKCRMAELRKFAQQRGLVDDVETARRKHLVEVLLLADENPHFSRFLEVPAELRTMIYEFYCADFADEPLVTPTYPPLARTTKMLRDEMLPVFYSSCTFAVGLAVDGWCDGEIPPVLHMQRETSLTFLSLSPKHLASMQKLEVSFESHFLMRQAQTFRMRFTLPRDGKRASVVVRVLDKYDQPSEERLVHS